MPQANLLDIAKLNGNDTVVGLIEENQTVAPDVMAFPARTIRGTSYKIGVRKSYPGVGFRTANGGTTYTKSEFVNRLIETFILSGNVRADVAVAGAYEDGPEAWKLVEASGVMAQSLIELGSQIYYGKSTDANGFPGLQEIHEAYSATLTAPLTVDALGTSAGTGSSVYGVKFGAQDCQLIFGTGNAFELGDWFQQMVNDGTAGQDYLAHVASLNAWVGLQVGSVYSVGRIRDLTADAGRGLTDALVAELLSKYPIGKTPDALFMNRRSAYQLQISRSPSSNTSGNAATTPFAALPTSSMGIPIIITDSILSTEALS
jgi:hypothetical protein